MAFSNMKWFKMDFNNLSWVMDQVSSGASLFSGHIVKDLIIGGMDQFFPNDSTGITDILHNLIGRGFFHSENIREPSEWFGPDSHRCYVYIKPTCIFPSAKPLLQGRFPLKIENAVVTLGTATFVVNVEVLFSIVEIPREDMLSFKALKPEMLCGCLDYTVYPESGTKMLKRSRSSNPVPKS